MSIAFFLLIAVGYCLLIGGGRRLFGMPRNAVAQLLRRRQVLSWLYWLTTAPVCLTLLAYSVPRVSLSDALLPAFALLVVGSGVVAGMYAQGEKWHRLRLAHAVVVGLLAPFVAHGFWVDGGLGKPLYQQYPFTVHRESVEDEAANWTWKGYAEPQTHAVFRLYKAGWGFDYYVGDIQLDYPPPPVGAGNASPAEADVDRAFWRHVRFLTLAPDDDQGQLRVLLPAPFGGYNAFTGQANPVAEQTLPFWVNRSPAPPRR